MSYGVDLTNAMVMDYNREKASIKRINSSNRIESMDMPAGVGGAGREYDINTGE